MASLPRIDLIHAFAQNPIINGAFDVWQRGTSFATVANATYTADRWRYNKSGTAVHTVSQETSTLPTFTQSGFNSRFALKIQPSTSQASPGATDSYSVAYYVEGQDYAQLHGQSVRLQFWAHSTVTGTFGVSFQNSATDRVYAATYTINNANTYEKKFIDVTLDNTGTWLFDTGIGLRIQFWITAGSSVTVAPNSWQTITAGANGPTGMTNTFNSSTANIMRIAQVSIVPGDLTQGGASNVDVPFRRAGRNVQQELAMCQRYYYRPNTETISAAGGAQFATGWASSTTAANTVITFPVRMRSTPTYSSSGSLAVSRINTTVAATSSAIDQNGNDSLRLQFVVASGLTAGEGIGHQITNNSSFIEFSSEL